MTTLQKIKILCLSLLLSSGVSWSKTVELVVPWSPGGTTDRVAQVVLTHARPEFAKNGITLNIAYRPGAGGLLGANSVAATEPGKMQILLAGNTMISTAIVNPGVATYDVEKDYVLLGYIGHVPMVTVVNSASGIRTVKDWQAACQRRSLNYGTAGTGSNTHISSALMSSMLGCSGTPVPYKGAAPAVNDLLGGHIDYLSDYASGVIQHIETGKFTPLVVLDKSRLPELPQVPTIVELGYREYNFYNWFALTSNSTADPADIALAQKIFSQILQSPEVNAQLQEVGIRGRRTVASDFLVQERRTFMQVLKRVNIK